MINTAIVGYLDVLGYKKLIDRFHANIGLIQDIENVLHNAAGLIEKFEQSKFEDENREKYVEQILSAIRVRFLSDSIIYVLNLSKIDFSPPQNITGSAKEHAVHIYFRLISGFCTFFIAKTGHVLRGGMAIGHHYENDIKISGSNSLFVFSKAYRDAVDLEEEERGKPRARIILSDGLEKYLNDDINLDMEEWTYRDDEKICFEIYNHLLPYPDDKMRTVLRDIKKGISHNMETNLSVSGIVSKLIYFAKYHNQWVGRKCLNYDDLLIDF